MLAPAATVTVAGMLATLVLLLDKLITAPPAGAALLSVTVPVAEAPPLSEVGLRLKPVSVTDGGVTVSVAVLLTPVYDAVMVTDVELVTAVVVTVKFAEAAPGLITTLVGTLATDGLLLVNTTTAPPEGAEPSSITMPLDGLLPTTDVGFRVTEDRLAGFTMSAAVCVVL